MPQKIGWSPLLDAKERGHTSFGAVADATPRELIIDCNSVDRLSVQLLWDAALTAAVTVLTSNSFIPDPKDMQAGTPVRAGAFTDITSRVTKTIDPAGGAERSQEIDCAFVSQGFIKIRIVRSAGSANVDAYVSGKTIGAQ